MSTETRDVDGLVEALRRRHLVVEDCWYSCREAGENYCGDDEGCDCGADKHNAKVDEALTALRTLRERYREEHAIVDRVWQALGIDTYEGAGGKSIDELVRTLREQVDDMRQRWHSADYDRIEAEARVAELEAHLETLIPLVPVPARQDKGPRWMRTQAGKHAAVVDAARRALDTKGGE